MFNSLLAAIALAWMTVTAGAMTITVQPGDVWLLSRAPGFFEYTTVFAFLPTPGPPPNLCQDCSYDMDYTGRFFNTIYPGGIRVFLSEPIAVERHCGTICDWQLLANPDFGFGVSDIYLSGFNQTFVLDAPAGRAELIPAVPVPPALLLGALSLLWLLGIAVKQRRA